jgi:hypothetical protein
MTMHTSSESDSPRFHRGGAGVVVRYELPGFAERWVLPERPVPESAWHDACLELVKALLVAWIARTARAAAVYRNLAVRVRSDRPNVGFDPDVCVVEPRPPEGDELESLKLWQSDHRAPSLVVESRKPQSSTQGLLGGAGEMRGRGRGRARGVRSEARGTRYRWRPPPSSDLAARAG